MDWRTFWRRSARRSRPGKELKPLVEEYQRLEAAERALAGVNGGTRRGAPSARVTPAPRVRVGLRHRAARPAQGLGHPLAAGARARARTPGHHDPRARRGDGIKQNYLYRVMPTLAEEGQVVKSGRGWHVRDKDAA